MIINRTVTTICAVVCLVLGIPVVYLFWKMPKYDLSQAERELVAFNSQALVVSQAKLQSVYSGLESPIKPLQEELPAVGATVRTAPAIAVPPAKNAANAVPVKPARQSAPVTGLPSVSMVYSDGVTMMAIIDGNVVKEGAMLGDKKIVKIEQRRVLIKGNGKTAWLDVQ